MNCRVSIVRVIFFALLSLGLFVAIVLLQMLFGIGPLGQAFVLLRGGGDDAWGVHFSDDFFLLASRYRLYEAWIIWPAILAVVGALFALKEKEVSWVALILLAFPAALVAGFLVWCRTVYLLVAYSGWLMLITWLVLKIRMRTMGTSRYVTGSRRKAPR